MQPSCTCKDNDRFGSYTHCKHILFVLMFGHGVTDETILGKVTYTEAETRDILSSTVNKTYVKESEPVKRRSKAQREDILRKNINYSDPQIAVLHLKTGQSAKCSGMGCNKILQIGENTIKIDGCISIIYQQSFAKKQVKFFCPSVDCLKKPPVWTNIRFPTKVEKTESASDALAAIINDELSKASMA